MVTRACAPALAVAIALTAAAVGAQEPAPCDRGLRPVASSFGYQARERNHRCEGLYESTVRAVALEVVSFSYGALRYDHDQDVLHVHAPLLADLVEAPVRIRAVALPLKAYYRMDAFAPAEGPLAWPLSSVIRPAGLEDRHLGLLGWVPGDDGPILVPLWASPGGGEPPSAPLPPAEALLQLGVRLSGDAERVLWRLRDAAGPAPWEVAAEGRLPAGTVVHVALPEGAPARLRVELVARWRHDGTWSPPLRVDLVRPQR